MLDRLREVFVRKLIEAISGENVIFYLQMALRFQIQSLEMAAFHFINEASLGFSIIRNGSDYDVRFYGELDDVAVQLLNESWFQEVVCYCCLKVFPKEEGLCFPNCYEVTLYVSGGIDFILLKAMFPRLARIHFNFSDVNALDSWNPELMPNVKQVYFEHLDSVSEEYRRVIYLSLRKYVERVDMDQFPSMGPAQILSFLEQFPRLNDLTLGQRVVKELVYAVLETVPVLYSLKILNASRLTDNFVEVLIQKQGKLRELFLYNCSGISPGAFDTLAGHYKGLEELALTGASVNRDTLATFFKNSPRLSFLDLSHVRFLLSKDLVSLEKKCKYLSALHLRCSYGLDEKKLFRFFEREKKIRELNLSGLPITDLLLDQIARNCPDLDHLVLVNCPINRGLKSIIKSCKELSGLDCSGTKISSETLRFIADSSGLMRHISLDNCDHIDFKSLMYFLDQKENLQYLSIHSSRGVSDYQIQILRERFPDVEIVS